MPERKPEDALDAAVEAVMKNRPLPADLPPDVAAVVRVAEHLRGLPDPGFRRRLKAALLGGSAQGAAPPPRIVAGADPGEIQRALDEMKARPPLTAHDLESALDGLPELSMRFLAQMNECVLGVSRFSRHSHWERHPAADELLYVLDGEMEVTTLTADGPVVSDVRRGAAFVCPRGLWHRVDPRESVAMLFATPGEGTEHSDATEPAHPAAEPFAGASVVSPPQDVRGGLRRARPLDIGAETTEEEADAAFRQLSAWNQCSLNVGRFRGLTPWERHANGDELLHVLDGEVDITVLTDDGAVHRRIGAGEIFICPRGLWHRQHAAQMTTGLFATPLPSDVSWAEDPRVGG